MKQGQLGWLANFIWGIAGDVLRRLDAVLEPSKRTTDEMGKGLEALRKKGPWLG